MMGASFKPAGWPAVIPRLIVADVDGLIGFLGATFDAQGEAAPGRPAEIWISDSVVLVSDGGGVRDPSPSFLYVYVPDADRTFARALAAGATEVEAPADMPWGDRRATVEDPWGNTWQLATHRPAGVPADNVRQS
jgi:PhnB protein